MDAKAEQAAPIREVQDVNTLKALSDPTRLAIMRTLMRDAHVTPRVMSVKELAQELGEPQTRLYRHVKQLAAVELIKVAETRVVSGILEHRYRAAQVSLRLSHKLFSDSENRSHAADVAAAAFDDFRYTFLGHITAGRIWFGSDPHHGEAQLAPMIAVLDMRLTATKAAEFRTRLKALIDAYDQGDTGSDTVPVELLCVFSSPREAT